jgi:hypothetical protein
MSNNENLSAARGVAVESRLAAERLTRGTSGVPGKDSLVDELTIINDQLRDWVSGVVAGFALIVPRGVLLERKEGLSRTTIPFMSRLRPPPRHPRNATPPSTREACWFRSPWS